jgi:hypothetical protein
MQSLELTLETSKGNPTINFLYISSWCFIYEKIWSLIGHGHGPEEGWRGAAVTGGVEATAKRGSAASIIRGTPSENTLSFAQSANQIPATTRDWTPLNTGKQTYFKSLSADPGGHRQFGRFWAQGEEISTPTMEEMITAASRKGFTIEELIKAEELLAAEKVSFQSPSSSDFRCPLSTKIIKAVTHERSLKYKVKPWTGPLPKPRVSSPKTLGDAVITNSRIRLRGGQTVPMLFKMSLPSTNNFKSSVQTSKKSD